MSGAAATRKLRSNGYSGMIIGVTGDPSGCDDRREFEAAGLNACVDKNMDGMAELAELIRARMVECSEDSAAAPS